MNVEKVFMETRKKDVFTDSMDYWNRGKTKEWLDLGIDLIIGKREGYNFWDLDGKKYMDVHINGGTYSLGHRNIEIIAALIDALGYVDIGNHHFPSPLKAALAKELIAVSPSNMRHVVYGSSGGEAVDLAIKCARFATKRRKVVCLQNCYHGHTGLSVCAGADRYKQLFLSDSPEFACVPFNDINKMEDALKKEDAACVIIETIPATYGFPLPAPEYLKKVEKLCKKYGSLYIADEVQTGLMRSGKMWCFETYGVCPDIIVTSKGLSGGIYPISAVILNESASGWMDIDGSAHMATFGGSELGCVCALKVLEILRRPSTQKNVSFVSTKLRGGLDLIREKNPDIFTGIRQNGTIMGLEFAGRKGAIPVMQHLYSNGVWAIYSQLDNHVLQFKPGILCDEIFCDELLAKLSIGIGEARKDIIHAHPSIQS